MKRIIILLLIIISFEAMAQDLVKKAEKKFRLKDMKEARALYNKAYLDDPMNYKILKGLALSNQRLGETEKAEKWMRIITGNYFSPADKFLFSELLKENDKLNEAELWFNKYARSYPRDLKTKAGRAYYSWVNELKANSLYKIKSLSLNSDASEIGTVDFDDGIVFSSGRFKKRTSRKGVIEDIDLCFAKKIDKTQFEDIFEFAPKLNTKYNDGPVSFDKSTGLMYVSRNAPKKAHLEEGESFYHMQIVVAKLKNNNWRLDKGFFFNSMHYTVAHPNVRTDGQILLFASDINGGYGGSDIYFCYKTDGEWSAPYNLGPEVNTSGNEFFPSIGSDNTLYFSSDGHKGVGGYDIFSATPEKGIFKNVKNLGYGINSAKDDISILMEPSGVSGYISSNRAGGKGLFDVYYFENQLTPIVISGMVKDNVSKIALPNIQVEIKYKNGERIAITETDEKGTFVFEMNKRDIMFMNAQSNKFEELENELKVRNLKKGDELEVEVFLNRK